MDTSAVVAGPWLLGFERDEVEFVGGDDVAGRLSRNTKRSVIFHIVKTLSGARCCSLAITIGQSCAITNGCIRISSIIQFPLQFFAFEYTLS